MPYKMGESLDGVHSFFIYFTRFVVSSKRLFICAVEGICARQIHRNTVNRLGILDERLRWYVFSP
jgi:hypothetical protein